VSTDTIPHIFGEIISSQATTHNVKGKDCSVKKELMKDKK
jgi:hypothetical protein